MSCTSQSSTKVEHWQSKVADFPLFSRPAADSGWEIETAHRVYDGPYVQIDHCQFRSPERPSGGIPWTVAYRKAAVAVAASNAQNQWLMIRQERLPVMQSLWEFPAGQIDAEISRSSILSTLQSELIEETGYNLSPDSIVTPLHWVFGSQGFMTEHCYLFHVTNLLQLTHFQSQGGEYIQEIRWFSQQELRQMIAQGTIQDTASLAIYARLSALELI